MSGKVVKDCECQECGAEYMITYNVDQSIDEPLFCPFCACAETDELDFED